MTLNADNQLDRLLEDWADKSAVSKDNLAALQQKVVEQLAEGSANALELARPSMASRRFVAAGLATAAVLLVSIGVWRYSLWQPTTGNPSQIASLINGDDSVGSFEAYWPKHLVRQQRLLAEYQDVFGQGLAWVAETDQSCDVGLAASGAKEVAPSEYIAIQLWLVARNKQDGQSEVHTVSVLVGREELVEIPAAAGGGQLVIWAYPVDEGMISIDFRYQPSSVVGAEIDGSNLQRVGRVTNIHSFERDGVEYRLYQTADLLDGDDLG